MNAPGYFITFEGIDGAGKSTHIAPLQHALAQAGHAVTLTREPGGTPLAEKLRSLILNDAMDSLTESLLVFAARRDHLKACIGPALARGEVVLCDRFTDASFAYQGFGRQFDLASLQTLESWVQASLQPDLTFWFDLEPDRAALRLSQARMADRFEGESLDFFTKVRAGYAWRASQAPQRFVRIDADQALPLVRAQVLDAARARGLF